MDFLYGPEVSTNKRSPGSIALVVDIFDTDLALALALAHPEVSS